MTNTIFFDCETTAQSAEQLALVKPQFNAPKNYVSPEKIAEAQARAEADWKERAALSAVTGRILAIGTLQDGEYQIIEGDEAGICAAFWALWVRREGRFVGWAIKWFDLPFLIRASWRHNIRIPIDVMEGRYFSNGFTDLAEIWCLNNREQKESLDTVAKMLGVGAKNGDSAQFGKLWLGTSEEKEQARRYLQNDLMLCQKIAERMGV